MGIKKNGKTDKMKLFAFFGLSVLVGASAIPSENRPQANSFLKREKRRMVYLDFYDSYEEWRKALIREERQDEVEEQREKPIRCLRRCTDTKQKCYRKCDPN